MAAVSFLGMDVSQGVWNGTKSRCAFTVPTVQMLLFSCIQAAARAGWGEYSDFMLTFKAEVSKFSGHKGHLTQNCSFGRPH